MFGRIKFSEFSRFSLIIFPKSPFSRFSLSCTNPASDKFRNLVTSTCRTGHCCDPSTLQNNTGMTWQKGGKTMYMIRSSALQEIGDRPPERVPSCYPILTLVLLSSAETRNLLQAIKHLRSRMALRHRDRLQRRVPLSTNLVFFNCKTGSENGKIQERVLDFFTTTVSDYLTLLKGSRSVTKEVRRMRYLCVQRTREVLFLHLMSKLFKFTILNLFEYFCICLSNNFSLRFTNNSKITIFYSQSRFNWP